MEWIETTAKTVEEARELALDRLHVDEAEAEFEVLEEPRAGLFGRVRGQARVRARVRPMQPRPKVDRRDRRRSARRGSGSDRSGSRTQSSAPPSDADADNGDGESSTEPAPSRQARSGGSRGKGRRPSGRQGAASSGDKSNQTNRSTNEETSMSDSSNSDNDVTVQEQAEIVQGFVEGLIDAFGMDAEVGSSEIDEDTIEVRVDGDDLGLLVGPRGATLQAIHDLSRSVVQRQATGTHHGRVRLDIAGYRERRRDALERFTQRLAQTAIETGAAQVLEPMSAVDRKVVHDTANAIDGVHTISEGEDFRRHVVIVPGND